MQGHRRTPSCLDCHGAWLATSCAPARSAATSAGTTSTASTTATAWPAVSAAATPGPPTTQAGELRFCLHCRADNCGEDRWRSPESAYARQRGTGWETVSPPRTMISHSMLAIALRARLRPHARASTARSARVLVFLRNCWPATEWKFYAAWRNNATAAARSSGGRSLAAIVARPFIPNRSAAVYHGTGCGARSRAHGSSAGSAAGRYARAAAPAAAARWSRRRASTTMTGSLRPAAPPR